MKNFSFLFFSSLIIISCAASKSNKPLPETVKTSSTVSTAENNKDSLLTGIERYPCFGKCPEYRFMVFKTGYASYFGRRNVTRLGTYSAKISTEQLNDIYNKVRAYNLEIKDSSYINKFLADYPGWKLWVADKNPRKEIMIVHEAPPKELTRYGEYLDGLIEQLGWQKISSDNRD